jgi:hypothetical protein
MCLPVVLQAEESDKHKKDKGVYYEPPHGWSVCNDGIVRH